MIDLPQEYRDEGFQRRIAQLKRAEELGGRGDVWWALFNEPWVTDHPFRPGTETHCMHGHSQDQIVVGRVPHHGREHVKRRCRTCESTWLEPVAAIDGML